MAGWRLSAKYDSKGLVRVEVYDDDGGKREPHKFGVYIMSARQADFFVYMLEKGCESQGIPFHAHGAFFTDPQPPLEAFRPHSKAAKQRADVGKRTIHLRAMTARAMTPPPAAPPVPDVPDVPPPPAAEPFSKTRGMNPVALALLLSDEQRARERDDG